MDWQELQHEVAALKGQGARPWREVARLLAAADMAKIWEGESVSFSAWLDSLADEMGVPASRLSRYHFAGKYWYYLSTAFLPTAEPLVPPQVRLEHLEILSELQPLVSQHEFTEVVKRVVANEVRCSELRAKLESLAPLNRQVLAVQIARATASAGFKDYP